MKGKVSALAPVRGAVGRVVQSGKPLYLNDTIATGPEGRLQILLLDETVFTIGPNSSMVLDEFVYDPATNAGKITASITKGVFRFVSGKIAKRQPSNMKVKLPVGTIGIRGTIVSGLIDGNNALIQLDSGAITLTDLNGHIQNINIPGFASIMTADYITKPFLPSLEQISHLAIGQMIEGRIKGSQLPAGAASSPPDLTSLNQPLTPDPVMYALAAIPVITAQVLTTPTPSSVVPAPTGNSTWDQMISNIPGGTGSYINSGTFTLTQCLGTVCSAPTGNWGFNLTADFTNHAITSGYGFGATANSGTFMVSDNVASVVTNFAARTGNALITDTHAVNGVGQPGTVTYTFQFKNTGLTANQVVGNVTYSNPLPQNEGSGSTLTATCAGCP